MVLTEEETGSAPDRCSTTNYLTTLTDQQSSWVELGDSTWPIWGKPRCSNCMLPLEISLKDATSADQMILPWLRDAGSVFTFADEPSRKWLPCRGRWAVKSCLDVTFVTRRCIILKCHQSALATYGWLPAAFQEQLDELSGRFFSPMQVASCATFRRLGICPLAKCCPCTVCPHATL